MRKHFLLNSAASGAFVFMTMACSATQSGFSGEQTASQTVSNKDAQAEVAKADEEKPAPAALPSVIPTPIEKIFIKSEQCWFAVSGGWIGYGDHGDVFPKTKSGRPVGPGEVFDDVGGLYLAARAEPYVYGQGAGEIDRAVDTSFDSILVAPGMNVEIRDGSGNKIFEGVGPIIAEAFYEANDPRWKPDLSGLYRKVLLQKKVTLPEWMQDWLSQNDKLLVVDILRARSVKVSAIPGGRCSD